MYFEFWLVIRDRLDRAAIAAAAADITGFGHAEVDRFIGDERQVGEDLGNADARDRTRA